jgi:hypothetical protein
MMTSIRVHCAAVLLVAVAALSLSGAAQTGSGSAKTANNDDALPLGDWRGDSICVVRESACHDEDSLYHVSRLAGRPGWFSMKLDKIVNGKPETMGTQECSYDSEKHTLQCEFARGSMQFTVSGSKMEGTMLLKDKTLWRRISLKKDGK